MLAPLRCTQAPSGAVAGDADVDLQHCTEYYAGNTLCLSFRRQGMGHGRESRRSSHRSHRESCRAPEEPRGLT